MSTMNESEREKRGNKLFCWLFPTVMLGSITLLGYVMWLVKNCGGH